jgi:hypothetical protein
VSYYRECPYCHAHLDPGEQCDCRADEAPDEPSDESPGEDSDEEPEGRDYPEN